MVDEKKEAIKQEIMGEDKPLVDKEHVPTQMAMDFLAKFYRLLKGTALYDRKNIIIDRLAGECLQSIQSIIKSEGQVYLKVVRDTFFFNNYRLQMKADKY